RMDRLDKAIEYLEKAIALAAKDAVIAEHLGDAYLKANRKTDALKMYEKAYSLDSSKKELAEKIERLKQSDKEAGSP
ncbi:MAG: tetratricopeptide repeat protein, partial [Thermodesulfobacteriota bacterium]